MANDDEQDDLTGKLVDIASGTATTTPAGQDAFIPVQCGPWPGKEVGHRQGRCTYCKTFIAISPTAVDFHELNPEKRPFACSTCVVHMQQLIADLRG